MAQLNNLLVTGSAKFLNTVTGNIDGNSATVNGHSVNSDVPSNAVFTDTTYTPASANPLMDGTVAVGTSVKYAREDHRHPSDTNKVSMSGNETVAGNKTFSGTTSLTAASIYPASTGTAIPANAAAIIQSPMPKYLWHDIFAFCRDCTPSYYTTTDGTTWTEATLNKNLFLHKMAWGRQMAISSTVKGSRWIWQTSSWSYSSATWLLIGVSYTATNAYFDILLETANSAGDWTTLLSKENCYYNSTPVWFKTNTPGSVAQVRLTIIRNANDATTNELPITSIRWLASRWGDQGRGEEFEYPYQWNENLDVYPTSNNVSNLGTSSVKWNTVYASSFSGNATSATKATQDESGNNIKASYAASASISGNTLTLKNKNNETLSTATIPSELPSVSSSDNNKVLTVVNGSWAAATASSGGSTPSIYTSTIPTTGWSEASEYGVEQTISFTGVTFSASDAIFIDLNISEDDSANDLLVQWDSLIRATPISNSSNIRILMSSEPDIALPVRIIKF